MSEKMNGLSDDMFVSGLAVFPESMDVSLSSGYIGMGVIESRCGQHAGVGFSVFETQKKNFTKRKQTERAPRSAIFLRLLASDPDSIQVLINQLEQAKQNLLVSKEGFARSLGGIKCPSCGLIEEVQVNIKQERVTEKECSECFAVFRSTHKINDQEWWVSEISINDQ